MSMATDEVQMHRDTSKLFLFFAIFNGRAQNAFAIIIIDYRTVITAPKIRSASNIDVTFKAQNLFVWLGSNVSWMFLRIQVGAGLSGLLEIRSSNWFLSSLNYDISACKVRFSAPNGTSKYSDYKMYNRKLGDEMKLESR